MVGAVGFKTKKELKAHIGKKMALNENFVETAVFGGPEYPKGGTGQMCMVGPDAFRSRKWYANCRLKDGVLVKVE